jgi:hypothetical protein
VKKIEEDGQAERKRKRKRNNRTVYN